MKSKVALRLEDYSPVGLVGFAVSVVSHMTGNAKFPTPEPALSEVSDATDILSSAISKAAGRDKEKIAFRDEKVVELSDLLILLGSYVQNVSKGVESVILSAGMDVRKPNSKTELPECPVHVTTAKMDLVGHVLLTWKRVANIRMYVVQKNTTPNLLDNGWTQIGWTTKTRFEVTGVELNNPVAFRVAALNVAGQSEWSEVAISPMW